MYLEVLKQEKKFAWHFLRLNDKKKCMTNAFRGKKLTTKLCVVYIQVKLQQSRSAY